MGFLEVGQRVRIRTRVYESGLVPKGSEGFITEVDPLVSYPYRVDVDGHNWLYSVEEVEAVDE